MNGGSRHLLSSCFGSFCWALKHHLFEAFDCHFRETRFLFTVLPPISCTFLFLRIGCSSLFGLDHFVKVKIRYRFIAILPSY